MRENEGAGAAAQETGGVIGADSFHPEDGYYSYLYLNGIRFDF